MQDKGASKPSKKGKKGKKSSKPVNPAYLRLLAKRKAAHMRCYGDTGDSGPRVSLVPFDVLRTNGCVHVRTKGLPSQFVRQSRRVLHYALGMKATALEEQLGRRPTCRELLKLV